MTTTLSDILQQYDITPFHCIFFLNMQENVYFVSEPNNKSKVFLTPDCRSLAKDSTGARSPVTFPVLSPSEATLRNNYNNGSRSVKWAEEALEAAPRALKSLYCFVAYRFIVRLSVMKHEQPGNTTQTAHTQRSEWSPVYLSSFILTEQHCPGQHIAVLTKSKRSLFLFFSFSW